MEAGIKAAGAERSLCPPAPPAVPCAPLLKWVGGKQRLLPELVRRLPPHFGRYFEPFAGGAALAFHLARPAMVIGDLNADLIATYQAVADQPDLVIERLQQLVARYPWSRADSYGRIRARWNEGLARDRAAMMIYLNRTCYNGLWRTNRKGEMNAPKGRYANPRICDPARIRACSTVLAACRLWATGYETSTCDARAGDLVYFDPPYAPASPTASFTGYTAAGFGEAEHRRLAEVAAHLGQRGVHVMASNADTPFVRKLYRDWRLHRVRVARPVNNRADGRGPVPELIIVNYDVSRRR